MKTVLMCDLEGVIIASEMGVLYHKKNSKYDSHDGIRNHAKYFISECEKIFDEVYMSTCCRKNETMKIMEEKIGANNIKYWDWKSIGFDKPDKYYLFGNVKLIHLEDSLEKPPFVEKFSGNIIRQGYNYIPVKPFYPHHAWNEKFKYWRKNDRELLDVLEKIKVILRE